MQPTSLDGLFTTPVQLIVADMDGTFLDAHHEFPEGGDDMIRQLASHGIRFVPASGRQYWRLRDMFSDHFEGMPFIADNGTLVMLDGQPLSASYVDSRVVSEAVSRVQGLDTDSGVVVCTEESAYTDRHDAPFVAECQKYYAHLDLVDDLTGLTDKVLKIAAFDFADAETTILPLLQEFGSESQVVLSGKHWVDLMPQGASKGHALKMIQEHLQISPDNTIVFGDYLNDLDMFDHARYSFAMANAHPELHEKAAYVAPPHTDNGVLTVLRAYLEQSNV